MLIDEKSLESHEDDRDVDNSYINDKDSDSDKNLMSKMMDNLEGHLGHQPELFKSVSKDSTLIPQLCCKKYSLLSSALLFNLKAKGYWIDSCFNLLLETLGKMFPVENEIRNSTYHGKKFMP